MKVDIYQSLSTLNELFQLATEHMDKLQSAGILRLNLLKSAGYCRLAAGRNKLQGD